MDDLFQAMTGVGLVLCIGTGFVVAVRWDARPGRTFGDVLDIRHNWKTFIMVGVVLMLVGVMGQIVT